MANFYEVTTPTGLEAINFDLVEKITTFGGATTIWLSGDQNGTTCEESISDILLGLDEYNKRKAVEVWRATDGKVS